MKKFIYLIFLPFALIACEGNDPYKDNEDVQFLKRVGQKVMYLVGEPASVVDSVMSQAGLKRIGQLGNPTDVYLYNAPQELDHRIIGYFREGDNLQVFNQIMTEKKMYIEVFVSYCNNVCCNIYAYSYISNDIPHADAYYLALSNSLYKKCSSLDTEFQWHGTIGDPPLPHYIKTKSYDYVDNYNKQSRRAFESVVNEDTERGFEESGIGNVVKNDGSQIRIVYNIGWANYDSKETAEYVRTGGLEPYIAGFFDIGKY